jgi:hypothetical protein
MIVAHMVRNTRGRRSFFYVVGTSRRTAAAVDRWLLAAGAGGLIHLLLVLAIGVAIYNLIVTRGRAI